jgi:F0F1-type ATP synthase assembly protein I
VQNVTKYAPAEQTLDQDDPANWGKYLSYGLQIAAGVTLGALVGNWLDHKFNWSPWGILVGCMLGLASGMYLLIKDALKMNKD